ncbi:uncharacterized protein LOC116303996 [Actinia tenebrosa]|uniref:Uncharacterized protein LOC116303996 n=1 Tax=Actinia tenebrosa TaxID=6105 RepID=A0A6P8IQY4_ACTTE|nr:uncharacterized protein LOC116303996 [Actinia tenebrosa]
MATNRTYACGRGLLKLLLVITSCVAFVCMIVADDKTTFKSDEYKRRYSFFLFAHIAGAASSLVIYLVFLCNVDGSIGSRKCWSFLVFLISLAAAVVYIVASALLTERAKDEFESGLYKLLESWKTMADLRVTAVVTKEAR